MLIPSIATGRFTTIFRKEGYEVGLFETTHYLSEEATSALDNESESEVARAIQNLTGSKTLLIVSHRLSTIRHCDRIFYLENGEVSDIGNFDELYNRHAPFRELVELGNLHVPGDGQAAQ